MRKLPKKSDMMGMDEEAKESKAEKKMEVDSGEDRPAKKVMQAIGQSLLKPKAKKKKAPKIPAGPSSQNSKKQNRVDKPDMSKDADDQE